MPPSSSGPGRSPFKATTGVRIPVGAQKGHLKWWLFYFLKTYPAGMGVIRVSVRVQRDLSSLIVGDFLFPASDRNHKMDLAWFVQALTRSTSATNQSPCNGKFRIPFIISPPTQIATPFARVLLEQGSCHLVWKDLCKKPQQPTRAATSSH